MLFFASFWSCYFWFCLFLGCGEKLWQCIWVMVLEGMDLRSLFLMVFRLLYLDFSGTCFHQWVNRGCPPNLIQKSCLGETYFLLPSLLWSSICGILKQVQVCCSECTLTTPKSSSSLLAAKPPFSPLPSCVFRCFLLGKVPLKLQSLDKGSGRTKRGSCSMRQKER